MCVWSRRLGGCHRGSFEMKWNFHLRFLLLCCLSFSIFKGISPYHGSCLILPHRLRKVFESTSHKTDDGWLKIVFKPFIDGQSSIRYARIKDSASFFCCCCCCWSFRVLLYSLRARCRHTYSIFIHRLSSLIEDRDLCAHVADSLHLRSFCVPFFFAAAAARCLMSGGHNHRKRVELSSSLFKLL